MHGLRQAIVAAITKTIKPKLTRKNNHHREIKQKWLLSDILMPMRVQSQSIRSHQTKTVVASSIILKISILCSINFPAIRASYTTKRLFNCSKISG